MGDPLNEMESCDDIMGNIFDQTDHMDSSNTSVSSSGSQSQSQSELKCWAEEDDEVLARLDGLRISRARKRKLRDTPPSDEDSEPEEDVPDSCGSSSLSDSKKINLIPTMMTLAFQTVGSCPLLLMNLFEHLTDNQIRSMMTVTKLWCKVGKSKIRQRAGNHPFVILWKSQGDFLKFIPRRFLYSAEAERKSIQAVFLAATASFEGSDLLTSCSTGLLKGVTCLFGLSGGLILTTPDLRSTFEIPANSSEYACQALCIQKSDRLFIKGFAASVKSEVDTQSLYQTLAAPNGLTLKGMILMMYQDEPLISNVIATRLNQESHPVPLVGGCVTVIRSSEDTCPDQLACGWAFFGNEHLRISSCALEVDAVPHIEQIYAQMEQHFHTSDNGFIFLFYKRETSRTEEIIKKIRQYVRVGIPVLGLEVLSESLYFQGHIPGVNPSSMHFTNVDPVLKSSVKMVALFVAY